MNRLLPHPQPQPAPTAVSVLSTLGLLEGLVLATIHNLLYLAEQMGGENSPLTWILFLVGTGAELLLVAVCLPAMLWARNQKLSTFHVLDILRRHHLQQLRPVADTVLLQTIASIIIWFFPSIFSAFLCTPFLFCTYSLLNHLQAAARYQRLLPADHPSQTG